MKNDATWDIFVTSMWHNQWTSNIVPLNDEFKNALYYESQGITDIAVKLYAMVQIRAIALGIDTFKPSDFQVAVEEGLALIKPMLDALRSGDRKKIDMYGDIAPVSIDDYYAAYSSVLAQRQNIPIKRSESLLSEQAVFKMLELGLEPAQAKRLIGKVLAEHQELRKIADVVRVAYTLYLSGPESAAMQGPQQGDLRSAGGYNDLKGSDALSVTDW